MTDNKFMIGGTIVSDDSQRWAFEDVTPVQVRSALSKLDKGEGITFEISSPGGDVTAGLAIANLIKAAQNAKHPCKAHVVGIAASMASVIACACDEIEIDESAFMMIHNPWTVAQGDAEELRKSADLLDKMRDTIMGFYRAKFERTDDELKCMMDEEIWFTGKECKDYGFKATVVPNDEPLKAAACARSLPAFAKTPENAAGLFVLGKHEESPMNEIKIEVKAEGEETPVENTPETPVEPAAPETTEEPSENQEAPVDAPEVAPESPDDVPQDQEAPKSEKTVDEIVSERLAGAMKSRDTEINALKAQLATDQKAAMDALAKMENDFKAQLAAKDEELTKAHAEVTRLAEAVKKAEGELQETASALKLKSDALATLNAAVNAPAAAVSYQDQMAKAKTPEEREALRAKKLRGEIK